MIKIWPKILKLAGNVGYFLIFFLPMFIFTHDIIDTFVAYLHPFLVFMYVKHSKKEYSITPRLY